MGDNLPGREEREDIEGVRSSLAELRDYVERFNRSQSTALPGEDEASAINQVTEALRRLEEQALKTQEALQWWQSK